MVYARMPSGVKGALVERSDGQYYQITGIQRMEPFLMNVVSNSDLWAWISSSGALTAGRIDADHALFPYMTDDRLHKMAEITGPLTIIACTLEGKRQIVASFWATRGGGTLCGEACAW